MKTKFTLDTTKVKAEIFLIHSEEKPSYQVAALIANALVGRDIVDHHELINVFIDVSKDAGVGIEASGKDTLSDFKLVVANGRLEKHEVMTGTSTGRKITEPYMNVTEEAVKAATDDGMRPFLDLDFADLELRVLAHMHAHQVCPEQLQRLSDFMGSELSKVLLGRKLDDNLLYLAEGAAHQALRHFVACHGGLSMDWFRIVIPQVEAIRQQALKEREAAAKAMAEAKEQRRIERVRGQVTRAVRAVRQSHCDTLLCVMGDTDAATAVLDEVETHLQMYYGKAVNTKFHEVREHAIKCVDGYISDKIAALSAAHTTVNNININVDKEADVRLVQKQVGEVSYTALETNSLLPENQVQITGEVGGFMTRHVMAHLDINNHTHKGEDSPCLEGLHGADRVQWLIDNVPASYLSSNLEMYCDMEDVKDWMLRVYKTKETIGQAYERLYGYDPIKTHFIPVQQHQKTVDEISALANNLEAEVIKRDVTIGEQINVIDKQNTQITDLNNGINEYKKVIDRLRSVMSVVG